MAQSKTTTVRDQTFRLTEAIGRCARAFTDAFAETAQGAANVAGTVAKGFADTVGSAIVESTDTVQRGVDSFFEALRQTGDCSNPDVTKTEVTTKTEVIKPDVSKTEVTRTAK